MNNAGIKPAEYWLKITYSRLGIVRKSKYQKTWNAPLYGVLYIEKSARRV